MKNDDQMFQSVLSRRNEYRERKNKRVRAIRRTVPVFACFCLIVALGVGYWNHFRNLPPIPVQPSTIENSTIEKTETTSASTDANTTVRSKASSEPASTTAPITNSHTDRMTTTASEQMQTVTTVVTDATEAQTTEQVVKQTETQAPATTPPVSVTQTNTEPSEITSADPPQTEVTEPIPPEEPADVSAPPIPFADVHAAAEAVSSGDVSAYPPEDRREYRRMFKRMKKDGFLYQVTGTDTVTLRDDLNVYLFPDTLYEDIGIGYYVTFRAKNYHIMFYYADDVSIAQTDGIADYLQYRMGRRSDKEINVSNTSVSLFFADNGQTYAGAFIDSDHYFTINSVVSEVEMIEFIKVFRFEALPLT